MVDRFRAAQQINPACGCYYDNVYWITFAGMATTDDPRYVIGVMMDNPATNADGTPGHSSAPLFHNIAGWLLQRGYTLGGINGGPHFRFSEAVSFTISCEDQDEIDYYWNRLTDGGEESQCGWCKDRFGLSWQIIPDRLYELVSHPDPACATAATQAMYGMGKIVIADLESAVAAV